MYKSMYIKYICIYEIIDFIYIYIYICMYKLMKPDSKPDIKAFHQVLDAKVMYRIIADYYFY